MPQLLSPTSSPRQHQQDSQDQQESNFSEKFTAEEIIKSDNGTIDSDEQASPKYSSVSSEDSEVEHIKTTTSKGRNELRVSQSHIMDKSQIERAL